MGQEQEKGERARAADVRIVYNHYRSHHPGKPIKMATGSKEGKAVSARLKEGYSVETLCRAIDGCHLTPHNQGQNDRGQKFLGLELIMRTADQVTRFAETAENPPKTGMTEKERRGVAATREFLDEVQE